MDRPFRTAPLLVPVTVDKTTINGDPNNDENDFDHDHPNVISQNSVNYVDDYEIGPVEESEYEPPSIASDINASMDMDVEGLELQSIASHKWNGGVLEFSANTRMVTLNGIHLTLSNWMTRI